MIKRLPVLLAAITILLVVPGAGLQADTTNIVADFDHSVNGMTVNFNNMSTTDAPNGIDSYFWEFGDSSAFDTSMNPIHTYDTSGSYNVFLSVHDGQCSGETTKSVSVGVTGIMAITELHSNAISCFPNPASNHVNISIDQHISSRGVLEVWNIEGKKVAGFGRLNGSVNHVWDASGIAPGIYLVTLRDNKLIHQTKVLIRQEE